MQLGQRNATVIHPTAVLAPGVELGVDVSIGPYTVVDANVRLGDRCRVGPHAYITGHTQIGAGCDIHSGAVLGDSPQDYHYTGEGKPTRLEIGDQCMIREYVTVHRGTEPGSVTRIGNRVMLMAMVHVAHNCELGDDVIMANSCILAGHVTIGSRCFLSAGVMIHQFCRVGEIAMIHGGERIKQDVIPYCLVAEDEVRGPNAVGLKRAGVAPEARKAIRAAVKRLCISGLSIPTAIQELENELGDVPEVRTMLEFAKSAKRGVVTGAKLGCPSTDD